MKTVEFEFNGLCAFVRDGQPAVPPTRIQALLLDSAISAADHPPHLPYLTLPLSALDAGSSSPDFVIDVAGANLVAVWHLKDRLLELGRGPLVSTNLRLGRAAAGPEPDHRDLSWIADLELAAGVGKVIPSCISATPPPMVSAVVKMGGGRFEALPEGRWESYRWKLESSSRRRPKPSYEQTLAPRSRFTVQLGEHVPHHAIHLSSLRGPSYSATVNILPGHPAVVCNLPTTPGHGDHFVAYYDISVSGQHLSLADRPVPVATVSSSSPARMMMSPEIFCPQGMLYE